MPTLKQVPGADGEDEHRAGDISSTDCVHEFGLGDRIKDHIANRVEFHPHRAWIEVRAGRTLHPGIRDQDPERRKIAADRHEPGYDQVLPPAEAVPAEKEEANESALEEEGHEPFDREWHAEDVPNIVR